jgi:hypothetical protein
VLRDKRLKREWARRGGIGGDTRAGFRQPEINMRERNADLAQFAGRGRRRWHVLPIIRWLPLGAAILASAVITTAAFGD